ncbi:MAG: hypothetical protein KJ834_19280 [Alphaproteobacteria bacterium]|nr:hypothetical protein [Alphaproteobacteria bacterium]
MRDPLSFMRFLSLKLDDSVRDAKMVWLHRYALAPAGVLEPLFMQFNGHIARQCWALDQLS